MNNLTSKEEMMRRIEELEQALEEEKRKKAVTRYGLIWEDSPEKLDDPNIVPLLSIDTDEYLTRFIKGNELNKDILMDEEKPMNYLIEGDNYHSLKALERTHTGKIDVIYIDPPYNTGNEFVYNDKIVDKEDGYRHSKWLSFMSKRLEIARRLMSDDGVIFVSIDEYEYAQLKLLMDSIFGEGNFLGMITWDKRNSKGNVKGLSHNTEYIHVYAKNRNMIQEMKVKKTGAKRMVTALEDIISKQGNNVDYNYTLSSFKKYLREDKTLKGGEKAYNKLTKDYRIYRTVSMDAPKKSKNTYRLIHPITNKECKLSSNGWRYKEETMKELIEQGLVDFGKDHTTIPSKIQYLDEYMEESMTTLFSSAKNGIEDLIDLGFSKSSFDNPKPLVLLTHLLSVFEKNVTVLDFFAGSGTTGHAVLELNKEDGGNRQFILCTNNEVSEEKVRNHFHEQGLIPKPNKTEFRKFEKENPDQVLDFMKSAEYQELGIARSVTYERLRRVIEGYTTPKGKDVAGIPANLMYLTTAEYTKEDVRRAREEGRFVDTTEMYAGIFYLKYPRTTHTVMFVTDDLSFNNFKGIDTLPTDNVVIVLSGLDYPHETANIIRKEVKTKNLIFEHLNR